MLYLWLWFVADILVMSCATGKRRHYILPAMPAAAILFGVIFDDLAFTLKANARDFARKFFAGHIIFFVCAFVALPVVLYRRHSEFAAVALTLSAMGLAWTFLLTIAALFGKKRIACTVAFAGFAIIMMFAYSKILNLDKSEYVVKDAALQVKQIIPPGDTLRAYYNLPARFVHYFGRSAPMINDKNEIKSLYEKGNWILVDSKRLPDIADPNYVVAHFDNDFKKDQEGFQSMTIFHKPAPSKP
jgi:4-amino-4-deoxy-L-arabinose transferase-like glycosyltransferase